MLNWIVDAALSIVVCVRWFGESVTVGHPARLYSTCSGAQLVPALHYFLAYVEAGSKDRSRLADCRKRLNLLPWVLPHWPGRAC